MAYSFRFLIGKVSTCLIRYPHGGTFEVSIPHRQSKHARLMGVSNMVKATVSIPHRQSKHNAILCCAFSMILHLEGPCPANYRSPVILRSMICKTPGREFQKSSTAGEIDSILRGLPQGRRSSLFAKAPLHPCQTTEIIK